MYKISAHTRCLTKLFRFGDRSHGEKNFVLGTGLITKKRDETCEKKRGVNIYEKRVKRIGAIVLGFIVALGTKVFGADASLYGVYPVETSPVEKFLPLLKVLFIFIIPVILIIGLFVYVRKNKDNANKSEKVEIAKIMYKSLLVLLIIAIIVVIATYVLGII